MSPDERKQRAAARALDEIKSGMVVGLGTGSTAAHLVRLLGAALAAGRLQDIVAIPTSERTAAMARELGIPLTTLDDTAAIDVTIDGADEFDPQLQLIKGLGGALLREKIVASVSRRLIIIADDRKRVAWLGTHAPVPVEVVPFAHRPVIAHLQALGARPVLRQVAGGKPFITDENNFILDAFVDPIQDPRALAAAIRRQPGVVEHGLFIDMTAAVIMADSAGGITLFEQPPAA